MRRVIVHLDADAFFASVEQASDPKLRGKPIAVGGEKRGIIASASYEARKFGVRTPMPTAQARRLCPKLIVLPGDYGRYEQFSGWMFGYAHDFTPDVEQTSIDEGYFDLSANRSKSPVEIAQTIRRAIQQKLKITVSEGIGSNKLVSAVASKLRKPAAFEEVRGGAEAEFLCPLPNHWLPGVGPKTAVQLDTAGLARIGQIAGTPIDLLELILGSSARTFRDYARGVDERPLIAAREPQKSYSQQQTFAADLTDEDYAEAVLRRMADELFASLREEGRTVRTLTVKVRYNDMDEDQRSESLEEPTDLETDVYGRLHGLLRAAWKRRVSLRLVSLKLSQVYDGRFRSELALTRPAQTRIACEKLSQAVDELRQKLGNQAVLRGHDLRLRQPPRELLEKSPQIFIRSVKPVRHVQLRMHSHYSFLDSTLSPEDIVTKAGDSGVVAMTDDGNLHGAVAFAMAAKRAGVKAVFGVELKTGNAPLLLYVENAKGYANLNRLLSVPRGSGDDAVATRQRHPILSDLLARHSDGLIAISTDVRLAHLYPGRFYQLASKHPKNGHPTVACPEVRHAAGERPRYDIVQAIRTGSLLQQAHPDKRTGRLHFRSAEELAAVAKEHPDWLDYAREIVDCCTFELPFGPPQFPAYRPADGSSSREFLRARVMEGARQRYVKRGANLPQLEEELRIIADVGYDEYFLVVWELLQDCRAAGIDWITRGSAADSLVCYCLGISNVCPIRFDLYFKRFLNADRMALNKLPDIDVDFPHDRKDDVVKMLFARYGAERCAVVGGFSTFQARSAVADVAKVLGVSEHQIRRFTENFPWSFGGGWVPADQQPAKGARLMEMLRSSPECRDLPFNEEPYKTAIETAAFLDGSPRNPKMHPCGVVLSRRPMMELTPTFTANKGYPTTHADMDGVELLGLVKLDVLAQGGLAVMRDAQVSIGARGLTVDLENCLAPGVPAGPFSARGEIWEDPAVWDMIAAGGSRAVHHIESPAMVSLCRQTNVRDIDTLIALVSVIRPGAANENKKLAFSRRYQGLEPTTYPHPSLEPCLRSTFGLVVYEEHILQICEVFAGMPPGRGDVLRRALVKQRAAIIEEFGGEFVAFARRQGHDDALILRVWELITGFSGYAFNKAHSTAYGVEAYQAAWLKRYFPSEFMAGVLTNGKGFYHPLVYVLECHRLGIRLLSPDANRPGPAFSVEGGDIRVPATRVKGLTDRTQARWLEARQTKVFESLTEFLTRVAPTMEEAEALLRCGVFDSFGAPRTEQFWQLRHWLRCHGHQSARQGWLLPPPGLELLTEVPLEEPTRLKRLQWETELLGFVASGHPLDLFPDVAWNLYCPVNRLHEYVGQVVTTCGLVVEQRTHHQVTGEPMKFLSLADWTGIVETELFAQTYRSYGLASVRYPVLEITAKVEPYENGRGFSLRVMRAGEPRRGLTPTHGSGSKAMLLDPEYACR